MSHNKAATKCGYAPFWGPGEELRREIEDPRAEAKRNAAAETRARQFDAAPELRKMWRAEQRLQLHQGCAVPWPVLHRAFPEIMGQDVFQRLRVLFAQDR